MTIKTMLRAGAGMIFVSGLAACDPGETINLDPSLTYDQMYTQGKVIFEAVDATPVTPVADMQPSGTATYAGVAALSSAPLTNSIDDGELLATVQLDANFNSGDLSGQMGNFRDSFGDSFDGTLDINSGQVTGNTLSADFSGQLTPSVGDTVTYDGGMTGQFRGATGGLVGGDITGTATYQNNTSSPFYGLFSAKRL